MFIKYNTRNDYTIKILTYKITKFRKIYQFFQALEC